MEGNCCTKSRDNKKSTVMAAKQTESEEASSNNDEIRITVGKVKLGQTEINKYQFNTGTIHYTTNERNCLTDIQDIDLKVLGHDSSRLTCIIKETLIFQHLRRTLRYYNILYNPIYSNLISGQKIDSHLIIHTKN